MVYQGRTTVFKEPNVLKGTKLAKPLEVLTFEYLEGDVDPNPPTVIQFRSDRDKGALGPHYLMLFLRKTTDGRCEPLTGREDPDCSVKVLGEADRG
jgi:hypothetical protein